ncbi:MAG TPA: nuclear transport factor 2 family protein [Armatimonadota bacterium]|jgi:hypothetical protein
MSSRRETVSYERGSALTNRREFLAAGLGMAAGAALVTVGAGGARAQQEGRSVGGPPPAGGSPKADRATSRVEQELLSLSRDKWRWMSERKVDTLAALFHKEAVFVHMGGTMSREQELNTIRSGAIQYKNAEIQEASVRVIGTAAIVLNRIRLLAVVGGNEVTNPFVVTEVYVKQRGTWKLASLSFTRTLG